MRSMRWQLQAVLSLLAMLSLLASAGAVDVSVAAMAGKMPLLPKALHQVPVVGETATIACPASSTFLDQVQDCEGGRFGLLLRTHGDQAVSWTPILQVERQDEHGMHVRCIGRVSIAPHSVSLVRESPSRAPYRDAVSASSDYYVIDPEMTTPYFDEPILDVDGVAAFDASLLETESMYAEFSARHRRAMELRGVTDEDQLPRVDGSTLLARAQQRVHTLDAGLAGPQFTPDSAERTLATFAAFDREVVGWKTRLAAMQCTSADGRLALAQRAIKFTTRRLEAEISLRAMGSAL